MLTNEVYYLNNLIYFNILIATLINKLHKYTLKPQNFEEPGVFHASN